MKYGTCWTRVARFEIHELSKVNMMVDDMIDQIFDMDLGVYCLNQSDQMLDEWIWYNVLGDQTKIIMF